jgi:C-terminal binding protein
MKETHSKSGQKFNIVVTDFIADSLEKEKQIVGDTAELIALDAKSEDDLAGKIEDADAIIVYHTVCITRKSIDRLAKCKIIVRAGVGIDNVDHLYARSKGIPVANIPDYGSEEVADTAIGMMLSLTRGINYLNSRLRDGLGDWNYAQVQPLKRLRNLNIGIVGLGRIGTATALRAKSVGTNVYFYDPFKPDGFDKAIGIKRMESLEGLLETVQVLSLHCPLTEATRHMVNEKSIEYLPQGSYLINTARGGVVDTSFVPDAINSGRLRGAAFDVFEHEPPVNDILVQAWKNPSHPAYHRVIVNPHAAFYCEEGLEEIRVKSAQACLHAIKNQFVRNIVN